MHKSIGQAAADKATVVDLKTEPVTHLFEVQQASVGKFGGTWFLWSGFPDSSFYNDENVKNIFFISRIGLYIR